MMPRGATHNFTSDFGRTAKTGQSSDLADALLRQVMRPRKTRHPMQGFSQMGESALAAHLMKKANG